MAEKIKVAKTTDIAEGTSKVVDAGGKQVAVFNIGGKFYAIANECAHQGGPLGDGFLSGACVTCPWHAWEYDLKTGKCETMPGANVETFEVKVEGDEVFLIL